MAARKKAAGGIVSAVALEVEKLFKLRAEHQQAIDAINNDLRALQEAIRKATGAAPTKLGRPKAAAKTKAPRKAKKAAAKKKRAGKGDKPQLRASSKKANVFEAIKSGTATTRADLFKLFKAKDKAGEQSVANCIAQLSSAKLIKSAGRGAYKVV